MTPEEMTMHAKLLRENPMFNDIMDAIERGLVMQIKRSNLASERELLVMATAFQVCEQITDYISECINAEKVTAFNIKQRESMM